MFSILKNVAKHSIIYGIADLLSKAVGFIMIPLYTHYLTTADYGTLELLDLTSYIISMFIGLGISQSVFRFYYNYEEDEKKKQVLSVSLITLWAASLVVLTGLLIFSKEISTLVFNSPANYLLFNIMFVTVVIQLSNQVPQCLLRIEQRSILFITINFIKLLINLSLNILFIVHFGMGVKGILLSGLIVSGLAAVYLLIYILRRVRLSFSFEILIPMLKYSLPLMWTWFGMFILNFGDRFILQRSASLSDVGIYSLAYKFGLIPTILILNPFMMMWLPKRFDLAKEPNAKDVFSVVFTYFIFFQIFIGLGISVLIKDIVLIIADPAYHSAYQYVSLIILAYIFRGASVYMEFGFHLEKKTKYLAYATLAGAGLNIGLNILIIPHMQVWGATLTTVISFFIMLIYIYFVSQKLYHIPFEFGRLIKMALTALALFVAAGFVNASNATISIAVKFAIALSFPFVLYLIKFYSARELTKIAEIRGQVLGLLQGDDGSLVKRISNIFRRDNS